MHPVLKAAIDNPRFAKPYGTNREDHGFGWDEGVIPVDIFIKRNLRGRRNDFKPANDNEKSS